MERLCYKSAFLLIMLGCLMACQPGLEGPLGQSIDGEAVTAQRYGKTSNTNASPHAREPITAIPETRLENSQKIILGEMLFNDPVLSGSGELSCNDCHNLKDNGAERVGLGIHEGHKATRNTPTVFNSSLNFRQFWDGRSVTLADQLEQVIHNPVEMNANWPMIVSRLKADTRYTRLFAAAYPEGVTEGTVKDAIVYFERSLVTHDSPFDNFLQGNTEAITAQARQGYDLFKSYGCIACHNGSNVGGNMFQTLGVFRQHFPEGHYTFVNDPGRYVLTGDDMDKHVFRVPSLRNIAVTGPYFHDGSVASLNEAVRVMAGLQLGIDIPDHDVNLIVEFLESLTGYYQGERL